MTFAKIINFLMSNWFLLVIAYIVINGLLGRWKSSRGGSGGQGPAPSMPPFGGDGSGWPKQKTSRPSQGQSAAPVPGAERQSPVPTVERTERMELARTVVTPEKTLQEPLEAPTGKELARGVLWAEILGPPRSRRPYRR
jgi:hypothetical protein